MSKPTPPAEFDRQRRRAERLHETRKALRGLSRAAKLEAIATLMSTTHDVRCPMCSGSGKVQSLKEPFISKEDALILLEEIQ